MIDNKTLIVSPTKSGTLVVKVRLIDEVIDDCIRIKPPNFFVLDEGGIGFEYFDKVLASGSVSNERLLDEYVYRNGIDTQKLELKYYTEDDGYIWDNFIHFGSAAEQVLNFYYKIQVLENYTDTINELTQSTGSLFNLTAQKEVERIIESKRKLVGGFTGFERYLYTDMTSPFPLDSYLTYGSTYQTVIQWYDEILDSAETFDRNNVHSIVNNIPKHIINDNESVEFTTFLSMIGHHFDLLWVYINSFKSMKFVENKKDIGVIDELVYPLLQSLGWNPDIGASSQLLWLYAFGVDSSGDEITEFSEKEYRRQIWRRLLNNLPMLYKHKGTRRALNAVMATYGIPESILNIMEFGGPSESYKNGELTKEYTYQDRSSALVLQSGSLVYVDWKPFDGVNYPNGVEFRVNTSYPSKQTVIEVPSAWKVDFTYNNDGGGNVEFLIYSGSTLLSSSTDLINIYNDTFTQLLLNRETGSLTDVYTLYAFEGENGRIRSRVSTSIELPSGDGLWSSSNQLQIGGDFIGYVDEFRLWNSPLNIDALANHTLSPDSINGNTLRSSTDDLLFRLDFEYPKNRTLDPYIKNVAYNQSYATFATASSFYSASEYPYQYEVYERTVTTQVPSTLYTYTDKIRFETIPSASILSPTKSITHKGLDRETIDSNRLGIFLSQTKELNLDIIKSFGGLNFDDLIGTPGDLYKRRYFDLDEIRKYYFERITLNPTEFIQLIKYIDKSIFEVFKQLIPARSRFSTGLLYEPHLLERSKYQWFPLKTQNLQSDEGVIPIELSTSAMESSIDMGIPIEVLPTINTDDLVANISHEVEIEQSIDLFDLIISTSSDISADVDTDFDAYIEHNLSLIVESDDVDMNIGIVDDTTIKFEYDLLSMGLNITDENTTEFTLDDYLLNITVSDTESIDFSPTGYSMDIQTKSETAIQATIDDYTAQIIKDAVEGRVRFSLSDIYGGENFGLDTEFGSGFNIFSTNGVAQITYRDGFNQLRKERKNVYLIKERYFVEIYAIVDPKETSLSKYDEYDWVQTEKHRYKLILTDFGDVAPTVSGNILEVTPVDGYLPNHYRYTNDLSAGMQNSFFRGAKNTSATTIDGGPVVEVFATNPNTLRVNESGRGSGEPILFTD